ncbi:hypothetical protein Tco_0011063 [Tanacetum coccineum]
MGDTIAQTRFESISKHSNDSLLARGNTLQSDDDRLKLNELRTLCTTLQNRVLDLEKTKTTQHNEIASLKRRVKKLKKKDRSRIHRLKRLYKVSLTARVESSDNEESLGEDASKQGRIDAIDADEEITLYLKKNESTKPKKKGVVIQELDYVLVFNYLKNMEGYKLKDLKLKEFDRAFKRVNTFEDFRTELVEGKENRAGIELVQKITKKQKVGDDKETTELKQLMKIIPDKEEVAIDAIPLAVKSPSIVSWKIYKEGRKSYYQIMRANGKSQMYMIFSQMLKSFDREDLEDLYKLVKAKYESTRPVKGLDLLL